MQSSSGCLSDGEDMTSGRCVTAGHRIQYAALRMLAWLINILPLSLVLHCGACLGRIAWIILRIRRKVTLINLRQAFPDRGETALEKIGLASYMNVGRFMMEFARQKKVTDGYLDKYVTWADPAQYEMITSLDTGVILLAFHFGNWELTGVTAKHSFGDVAFLVGEQHNSLVDNYINELRASQDIELYTRDAALRGVVTSIRRKGMVCWLSDQDAGKNGLLVDFFGFPASTPRGAAAFSVKLDVPIWCIFLERQKGPHHRFIGSELLYPACDLSQDDAELELTQRYTRILEEMVAERPEQYWWAHRRWKTTGLYRQETGKARE
jgi:KDO2-lipid IV(A) lauroyltransferase